MCSPHALGGIAAVENARTRSRVTLRGRDVSDGTSPFAPESLLRGAPSAALRAFCSISVAQRGGQFPGGCRVRRLVITVSAVLCLLAPAGLAGPAGAEPGHEPTLPA